MSSNILHTAYSSERFKAQGYALVDLLTTYLERAAHPSNEDKTLDWDTPNERYAAWKETPPQSLLEIFERVLQQSMHLHYPKYVGHQVTAPAPTAALASLFSSLVNNGMAIYEVGTAATVLERLVVERVNKAIGYRAEASGILSSGGTLGNLTALLTARSVKLAGHIWENGNQQQQFALMVSEEAHYCVDRAVRIMGWGSAGIIKVPTDENFRMRTEILEDLYQKATAEGRQIIAVVGSACSTSTGTFDDLNAIADFCEARNLWFHVDGAHGAASVFSEKYVHLVAGIQRADSVVMDFHKMLLVPALVTGVFYKNGHTSYQTFAQKAHYLWRNDQELEWYNVGKRSFECTKLMMSLQVYTLLQEHGVALWNEFVTKCYDLGKEFAKLLHTKSNFELAHTPDCNIVCFRYAPADFQGDLDKLNQRIRQELLEDGTFYFVQTQLRATTYLRVTLISPFTTIGHLELLLKRIEDVGKRYTSK